MVWREEVWRRYKGREGEIRSGWRMLYVYGGIVVMGRVGIGLTALSGEGDMVS